MTRVLRRPVLWWVAVLVLGAATTVAVGTAATEAATARKGWGTSGRVAVATSPIEIGDQIMAAIEWRDHPRATIPKGAASEVGRDDVARLPIGVGEVVVAGDLGRGQSRLAEVLPEGTAAMTIPPGTGWPPLTVGDRVDLLATFNTSSGLGAAAQRIATEAVVVELDEDVATIAVAEADVSAVASALAQAVIVAVLIPAAAA